MFTKEEIYKNSPKVTLHLSCGHEQKLAVDDLKKPKDVQCTAPVEKRLACGHLEKVQCYRKELKELITCSRVLDIMLECGHFEKVECYRKEGITCSRVLDMTLACGHREMIPCLTWNTKMNDCSRSTLKELPCGHKQVSCQDAVQCKELVQKLLACGHGKVLLYCHQTVSTYKCKDEVTKNLCCGHKVKTSCHDLNNFSKCLIPVMKKLPCGHSQKAACHQRAEEVNCETLVATRKCSHKGMIECSKSKNMLLSAECDQTCPKIFDCGHRCRFMCHENNNSLHLEYVCTEKCIKCLSSGCAETHECFNIHHYENNDKTSRIPSQFLNLLGFIKYDHYGRKPFASQNCEVYLSPLYKSFTNLLGIDCEMVGVGKFKNNALARVSIVNEYGYCVYDTFVKPQEAVTDYRTQFSGIRATDLINAPDVRVVLQEVAKKVRYKTLVGHSIDNDLAVLKLWNHPRNLIRDTAEYFKKKLGARRSPSLKMLTRKYLSVNIQTGEHNSIEDAQATLKLYLINREQWEKNLDKIKPQRQVVIQGPSASKYSARNVFPATSAKNLGLSNSPTNVSPASSVKKQKEDSEKVSMQSQVLPCGHHQKITKEQMKDISHVQCTTIVNKTLPCGHKQKITCFINSGFTCLEKVNKELPCGHKMLLFCYENANKVNCKIALKNLLPCGDK